MRMGVSQGENTHRHHAMWALEKPYVENAWTRIKATPDPEQTEERVSNHSKPSYFEFETQ